MRSWHGLIVLAIAQLALRAHGGVKMVLTQAYVRTPAPVCCVPWMSRPVALVPLPARNVPLSADDAMFARTFT